MRIVIVTPASADANNGNLRTAQRWARLLKHCGHATRVVHGAWPDGPNATNSEDAAQDELMVALHATKSAPSVQAWTAAAPLSPPASAPRRGLVVVLTGTDLYRDLQTPSPERSLALQSLRTAHAVAVLHAAAHDDLMPLQAEVPGLLARSRVVLQSATARATLDKPAHRLRAVMVGHLRAVKDPGTLMRAAELLHDDRFLFIDHIGQALEPEWTLRAEQTRHVNPRYRWRGALDHAATRRHIQRAHVLVHTSVAEGGAHVITEALRSGTAVLASDIPGNRGLLGADYPGLFPVGDAQALAQALRRAHADRAWLQQLQTVCGQLAQRHTAQAEAQALDRLVHDAMMMNLH